MKILHFLSSPEVLSHSVFPIGVVDTHGDLSITVKTKSISLSRHLTLARHGKRYSTNKLFGDLDDPSMEREREIERGGGEREREKRREEGRKMIRLELCRYDLLQLLGFADKYIQHKHTCST